VAKYLIIFALCWTFSTQTNSFFTDHTIPILAKCATFIKTFKKDIHDLFKSDLRTNIAIGFTTGAVAVWLTLKNIFKTEQWFKKRDKKDGLLPVEDEEKKKTKLLSKGVLINSNPSTGYNSPNDSAPGTGYHTPTSENLKMPYMVDNSPISKEDQEKLMRIVQEDEEKEEARRRYLKEKNLPSSPPGEIRRLWNNPGVLPIKKEYKGVLWCINTSEGEIGEFVLTCNGERVDPSILQETNQHVLTSS